MLNKLALMPVRPPVLQSAIIQSSRWALDDQTFVPLMRQPLPTGSARVRAAARSEPLSGSLMPIAKQISVVAMRGRNQARCSSVPKRRISGAVCRSAIQCAATGAPPASNSSSTTYRSSRSFSWPP